jgi:hypothetical protein
MIRPPSVPSLISNIEEFNIGAPPDGVNPLARQLASGRARRRRALSHPASGKKRRIKMWF